MGNVGSKGSSEDRPPIAKQPIHLANRSEPVGSHSPAPSSSGPSASTRAAILRKRGPRAPTRHARLRPAATRAAVLPLLLRRVQRGDQVWPGGLVTTIGSFNAPVNHIDTLKERK